jgi:hypothetical protein
MGISEVEDLGVWVPVCPICRTQTITALRGQHRCLDCGRVWDGTEREEVDNFAPLAFTCDDMARDDVVDILAFFWRNGLIEENGHGQQAESRKV